jgi:hypothetical protein
MGCCDSLRGSWLSCFTNLHGSGPYWRRQSGAPLLLPRNRWNVQSKCLAGIILNLLSHLSTGGSFLPIEIALFYSLLTQISRVKSPTTH